MLATSNQKYQTGCLLLIVVPLCIGGLLALVAAAGIAMTPPVNWLKVAGLMVFGVTLPAAGWAIFLAHRKGKEITAKQDRMRQLYPQSPWMWREDWSQGRVQSTTRNSMVATWVFALIWNLFCSFMLVFVPRDTAPTAAIVVVMLFPAAGVYLLVLAVRLTMRWEKYGATWFELGTLPGVIGKELRGSIHVKFPQPPEESVQLKLSCVNRIVTNSGKDRSTSEKILWRDEYDLPSGKIHGGPIGSAIPVTFKIPVDAVDTNTENPSNSIIWCLQADAKTPGVDYQDIFEVPVFHTTEDTAATTDQESSSGFSIMPTVVSAEKPLDTGIVVRQSMSDGTEYDFSAARNVGMAFGTTIFFVIFSVVVWFIIHVKAPIIFLIVFGGFDLILLMMVLSLWLGTSKLVIASDRVKLQKGLLGVGPTREVEFSQIADVIMPIGMQSGERAGTPYYDIRLKLTDGKEVKVAGGIRSKPEAEWLVARLKTEIGLSPLSL
jgi:hypothetical protein